MCHYLGPLKKDFINIINTCMEHFFTINNIPVTIIYNQLKQSDLLIRKIKKKWHKKKAFYDQFVVLLQKSY